MRQSVRVKTPVSSEETIDFLISTASRYSRSGSKKTMLNQGSYKHILETVAEFHNKHGLNLDELVSSRLHLSSSRASITTPNRAEAYTEQLLRLFSDMLSTQRGVIVSDRFILDMLSSFHDRHGGQGRDSLEWDPQQWERFYIRNILLTAGSIPESVMLSGLSWLTNIEDPLRDSKVSKAVSMFSRECAARALMHFGPEDFGLGMRDRITMMEKFILEDGMGFVKKSNSKFILKWLDSVDQTSDMMMDLYSKVESNRRISWFFDLWISALGKNISRGLAHHMVHEVQSGNMNISLKSILLHGAGKIDRDTVREYVIGVNSDDKTRHVWLKFADGNFSDSELENLSVHGKTLRLRSTSSRIIRDRGIPVSGSTIDSKFAEDQSPSLSRVWERIAMNTLDASMDGAGEDAECMDFSI